MKKSALLLACTLSLTVMASARPASASGCVKLPEVLDCNGSTQNLKIQQSQSGRRFKFELNEKVRSVGEGVLLDGQTQSAVQDWDDHQNSFDVKLATGQCQGNQIQIKIDGSASNQVWTFEKRNSKTVLLAIRYLHPKTNQQLGFSDLSCEKSAN